LSRLALAIKRSELTKTFRWLTLLSVILASPTLLFLSWGKDNSIVFLIFVALVPLFLGEHFLCTQRVSKYLLGFSSITIFHLIAGFRIFADVDVAKILMILLVNAVILSIPWAIYTQIKRAYSLHFSLLALVVSWIALEYLTTHINLMIPWFDLGNSLGGYPELIQWYEFTGISGGTLWILVINAITFYCIYVFIFKGLFGLVPIAMILLFCLFIPKIISDRIIFDERGAKAEVLILGINDNAQQSVINVTFDEILKASKHSVSDQTIYIFWPESTITMIVDESLDEESYLVTRVREELAFGKISVIGGITLNRNNRLYNIALIISEFENLFYIKQKLVPFAEFNPLPLVPWFNLIRGSHTQFTTTKNNVNTKAPMSIGICYESLFGELISRNCLDSQCQFVAILSNETWTPGASKNLMNVAAIRAIETRKYVVRSTINGITSLISPRGHLAVRQTGNSRIEVLVSEIIPNQEVTFYMEHGDLLGQSSLILIAIFMLYRKLRGLLVSRLIVLFGRST
jgi:apolipoprotein N-acyltransferase